MSKFETPACPWRAGLTRARARAIVGGCIFVLSACSTAPPPGPYAGNDPADSAQPGSTIAPDSYLGVYVVRRPVEPLSWREQNERVAPGRRP